MSVANLLLVAVLILMLALTTLRVVARRRLLVVLLLDLPMAVLMLRWAAYRGEWRELGAAAVGAGLALILWWLVYGRRLAAPRDDNIRVWTNDDSA
jgi:hypothetical protein